MKTEFSIISLKNHGSIKYSENIKLREHFQVEIFLYVVTLSGTSPKTQKQLAQHTCISHFPYLRSLE